MMLYALQIHYTCSTLTCGQVHTIQKLVLRCKLYIHSVKYSVKQGSNIFTICNHSNCPTTIVKDLMLKASVEQLANLFRLHVFSALKFGFNCESVSYDMVSCLDAQSSNTI